MCRGGRANRLTTVLLLWCVGGVVSLAQAEPTQPAKGDAAKAVTLRDEDYELQRVLADTIDQVQRNYVREVSRQKLIQAAIKGILTELDPYSAYISPEEMGQFRSTLESEFGGIGIHVAVDGKRLKVLSPMVGTPAQRAGLRAGDTIVEIDGKSTANWTIEDAVRRIKGAPGTQVAVTVARPDLPDKITVKITREMIHVDTVLGNRRRPDNRWDFMLDPEKGVGYIRVTAFSRETGKELRRALEELQSQKLRGLVLDLRFNPGGLLTSAVEVSNLFISKGRIVSTSGRNSPERVWEARSGGAFEGFPMAILVNQYSASASEIVSACLQDHKRAVIVGERTWGKGSVQNVIPLDDGTPDGATASTGRDPEPHSALKLTIAGYRRPSGKNIDRLPGAKPTDAWGVSPDPGYEVKLSDEERMTLMNERAQRDAFLLPPASANAQQAADKAKAQRQSARPVDAQLQKALDYLNTELARK